MFRVATGVFLSSVTPRLTSRLTFTHGLAHRAARRLAHALDRADVADNIQPVASCQVARQVAGSVPLQLGSLGLVHYLGTRKTTFLSMNHFSGGAGYYQQTTTKPRSLIFNTPATTQPTPQNCVNCASLFFNRLCFISFERLSMVMNCTINPRRRRRSTCGA